MAKTSAKPSNAGKVLKKVLAPYRNLVVVGGNWGDEGKGKIIDLVMEHYDVTVRFSGGANAGHTVYTSNGKKLSQPFNSLRLGPAQRMRHGPGRIGGSPTVFRGIGGVPKKF